LCTASALDTRASSLHAVETPAIETAMTGADASLVDIRPDGAVSTSPTACFPRRLRAGGVSGATMGTKCTEGPVPNPGTPSHLR
jgi:hypothetical protein